MCDLIENDGVSALKDIDSFDIAIVGGSGRDMEPILDLVDEKLNSKRKNTYTLYSC